MHGQSSLRLMLVGAIATMAAGCGGTFFPSEPFDFNFCPNGRTAVVGKVTVSPATLTLRPGQVLGLTVDLKNPAGQPELCFPAVAWSSSNSAVATVDSGTVRAVGVGTASISATSGTVTDQVVVTVVSTSIASLTIDAPPAMLVGQTARLRFVARDPAGIVLVTVAPVWSSTDPSRATITAGGFVSALESGVTVIHATVEGKEATVSIPVWRGPPSVKFRAISAGNQHTCAIVGGGVTEGTALCWGEGSQGQIGNGTAQRALVPQYVVAGGVLFKAIDAGWFHTCAISTAGETYCWGQNSSGQLGTGNKVSTLKPVKVSTSVAFNAITLSQTSSCGLTADGLTYCWGDMSGVTSLVPTLIPDVPRFKQLVSEANLTCGLTDGGEHFRAALCSRASRLAEVRHAESRRSARGASVRRS
jgi:hypothetical protein